MCAWDIGGTSDFLSRLSQSWGLFCVIVNRRCLHEHNLTLTEYIVCYSCAKDDHGSRENLMKRIELLLSPLQIKWRVSYNGPSYQDKEN